MDIRLNNQRPSCRQVFKLFVKIYWRTIYILVIPILFLPLICLENAAYKSLFVLLIFAAYLISDVLPACIATLIAVASLTIFGLFDPSFVIIMHMSGTILDTLSVMMIIIAIEDTDLHKRIAIKLILFLGCSHFRLSFLLFFTTMLLSMWITNTVTCGLMLPLVKAVLSELEKLGLIEMQQMTLKSYRNINENEVIAPLPSDVSIFYFLGIAYSATVGGMANIVESETSQVFKIFSETMFPTGPELQFPHLMLLSLPGVLLIQAILFLWMNAYFLGMFRVHSEVALQISMTEEEAQYATALLTTEYLQLGRMRFHQIALSVVLVLTLLLEATKSSVYLQEPLFFQINNGHIKMSGPAVISVVLLFLIPIDLEFTNFFKKNYEGPLPKRPNKGCLNWKLIRKNMHWSVLIILGGSTCVFNQLLQSHMTDEFEKLLLMTSSWAAPAIALVVIFFCKLLTELAPNSTVVYCLLPLIARLWLALCAHYSLDLIIGYRHSTSKTFTSPQSNQTNLHPHYLMLAATLASSLPFHLVTGAPVNALVCAYVRIPAYKMLLAGAVPSLAAVAVTWFTVTVWSRAVWPDIALRPAWADNYVDVFK